MDWVQIGTAFGVPMLILCGVGIFVYRQVWPFVVKQLERTQDDRRRERDEFLTALRQRDAELSHIVTEIQSLTLMIRRANENGERLVHGVQSLAVSIKLLRESHQPQIPSGKEHGK